MPAYVCHNGKCFGVTHAVIQTSEINVEAMLTSYGYKSLDELKESYGDDWEGILAEFESETMLCGGYRYITPYGMTWKDAEVIIIEQVLKNSRETGI